MPGPIGFVIVGSCCYAEARVTIVGSPKFSRAKDAQDQKLVLCRF